MASTINHLPPWKYDVFLSFRGGDTRTNFTSHLYRALSQRGITAYRDDKELARGDSIEPSLLNAIESSRFSIVVFSRNYAWSAWCLEELSKIVECRGGGCHTVFPVFYDVDPNDGGYRKRAIDRHMKDRCSEKVRRWEEALEEVMAIAGLVVMNKDESEMVTEIVEHVWNHLTHSPPSIMKDSTHLVGMDSRINQVMKLLGDKDSDDTNVRLIGICGMGGIGKTTLARVLHHTLLHSSKFQGQSCFLHNVRERFEKHGPTHLQEHLLSDILMEKNTVEIRDPEKGRILLKKCLQQKKVLIVLDDVDDPHQLEMLAVSRDSFGPGSRIVVTTRDKELVKRYACSNSSYWEEAECEVCSLEKLGESESLRLFSFKAFNGEDPAKGYEEMSKCVLKYCQGLPLAIKVLGCLLNGRSKAEWESQISLLKGEDYFVDDDILKVLKISFDGLSKYQQDMFLDIACFLKGKDVSDGSRILTSCGFPAEIGLKVLAEKSLLTTCYGRLEMHDLLQEMGREIVRRESPNDPEERSRLWCPDDVFHVLETATGTKMVEAIVLDLPSKDATEVLQSCNEKAFEKMNGLRLLIVRNVEFDQGPRDLPNGLRFLDWDGYPSDSLPGSFIPSKLVELNMCNSNIKQLCCGRAKNFSKLKVMNLSHSHKLIKTPDFTAIPNLERLALEDCTSLTEIHPSIVHLEKLVHLNFSGCTNINKFPHTIGKKMKSLQELLLDGTNIEELPESIKFFAGLSKLSLKDCKSLKIVPKGISRLKSLKVFNLSGCSQLDNVPENLGDVESLEELDVSGTAIRNPPVSIFSLKNLKVLSFQGCNNGLSSNPSVLMMPPVFGFPFIRIMNLANCGLGEGDIPRQLGKLPSLHSLDLSGNNFVSLPNITQLCRLHELHLENCKMLKRLPKLPSKIKYVVVNRCSSLGKLPNPIKLRSDLFFLEGFDCPKLQNGQDAGFIMFLRYLQGCWWDAPLPRERSGIVVPGSKIPSWFNHQSEGTSVKIRIPSCYRDTNFDDADSHDIMGLAFCIALKVTDPHDNHGSTDAVHQQDSSEEPHDEEMEGYSSEESTDMSDTDEVYSQDSSSSSATPDNEPIDESHDSSYDDYDDDDDEEMEDYYSSDYDNEDYPDEDDEDYSFSRKRKYSTYAEGVADTGEASPKLQPNPLPEEECGGEEGEHLWYFFLPYYKFTEYMKGQRHIYIELEGCTELKVIRTGCRLVRMGDIEEEEEINSDDEDGEYCGTDHGDEKGKAYKMASSPYNICYYGDKMLIIGMYFFYATNYSSSASSSTASRSNRASLGVYVFRR